MDEKNYEGYTEEEVAVALKIIREICCCNMDSEDECMVECPFLELQDGGARQICPITYNYPAVWRLNKFPPKQWEPFYKG